MLLIFYGGLSEPRVYVPRLTKIKHWYIFPTLCTQKTFSSKINFWAVSSVSSTTGTSAPWPPTLLQTTVSPSISSPFPKTAHVCSTPPNQTKLRRAIIHGYPCFAGYNSTWSVFFCCLTQYKEIIYAFCNFKKARGKPIKQKTQRLASNFTKTKKSRTRLKTPLNTGNRERQHLSLCYARSTFCSPPPIVTFRLDIVLKYTKNTIATPPIPNTTKPKHFAATTTLKTLARKTAPYHNKMIKHKTTTKRRFKHKNRKRRDNSNRKKKIISACTQKTKTNMTK